VIGLVSQDIEIFLEGGRSRSPIFGSDYLYCVGMSIMNHDEMTPSL
jgi:hypothetical protein